MYVLIMMYYTLFYVRPYYDGFYIILCTSSLWCIRQYFMYVFIIMVDYLVVQKCDKGW